MGPAPVSGRSTGNQRRSRTSSGSASRPNSKSTPVGPIHPSPLTTDCAVSNLSKTKRAVSPSVIVMARLDTSSAWLTKRSVPAASSTSIMKGASGSVTRVTGKRPLRFDNSNRRSNSPSGVSVRAQGHSPARARRSASALSAPVSVSVHGARTWTRPEATVVLRSRMPRAGSAPRVAGASVAAAGRPPPGPGRRRGARRAGEPRRPPSWPPASSWPPSPPWPPWPGAHRRRVRSSRCRPRTGGDAGPDRACGAAARSVAGAGAPRVRIRS